MSTLEWLLLVVIVSGILTFILKLSKPSKLIILGLCLLFLLLHFFLDGSRWQFIPIYLAALTIGLSLFNRKWLIPSGVFLVLGISFNFLFPIFQFPVPSGQYSIGHQVIQVEDQNRLEEITEEKGDFRKLALQIWYPSEEELSNPSIYMDEGYAEAFATSKGVPTFLFSHFDQIKTHIQEDILPADDNFPVLVLSHGLIWNNELYTSLIETLVSEGYLVIGVEHTYECPITFVDGISITPSYENLAEMNEAMDFGRFKSLEEQLKNTEKKSERARLIDEMMDSFNGYKLGIDRWSADLSFVTEELKKMNQQSNHFLYQKLDIDKIGLLGHSWGGTAVAQNAAYNKDVKAVVNMDGAQWGRLIDTFLQVPVMALYADRDYETFFTPNFDVYDNVAKGDYYEAIITNTGHANFGDLGYYTLLHFLTETGSISPDRMTEINTTLLLKFFDKYLRGKEIDLEADFGTADFGELQFRKQNH